MGSRVGGGGWGDPGLGTSGIRVVEEGVFHAHAAVERRSLTWRARIAFVQSSWRSVTPIVAPSRLSVNNAARSHGREQPGDG